MTRETSLYLDFLIADSNADAAEAVLKIALDAVPIASFLLRGDMGCAKRLVALPQKRGIAVLLDGAPQQADDLKCDGLHLAWSEDIVQRYKDARRATFADAMIGADAGRTRHDAMELGEAGADYVAFGIPPHVGDRARAAERQLDLIQWWSELFEVPCVAFNVPDAAAAAALAKAGADFVAVTLPSDTNAKDAETMLRAFAEAVRVHEPAS